MALFGRRTSDPEVAEDVAAKDDTAAPRRWGRRRSSSPTTPATPREPVVPSAIRIPSLRRGLLRRRDADPTIVAARERVLSAEGAERDADRALHLARVAVKEVREHVKRLEKEAAEQARLAKIKQSQARDISRRAKPLGRHDHFP